MLAFLLTRIVARKQFISYSEKSSIFLGQSISYSSPIFRKTCEQFISYSSITQIRENFIIEVSSSVTEYIYHAPSITRLLKSYDFTDTQITKILTKFQPKPSHNSTELIRTKLDFFLSIGFSNTQLAKVISANSNLLRRSLENQLKPNILLLKSFFKMEELLPHALFSCSLLVQSKLETNFFPNVSTLSRLGVPRANIIKLATQHPRSMLAPTEKFDKMVQLVLSMGFDPLSTMFCKGLHVIIGTNPVSWKRKENLYKSLGWSEYNVISAFVRNPTCMLASEKKIEQVFEFFVNVKHCEPQYLANYPMLINFNLEKRIMPRCLVMDIIVKKQLVKSARSANHYFISSENFVAKYVMPYQDQVPEVLHAYNGNLTFACLENESQIS